MSQSRVGVLRSTGLDRLGALTSWIAGVVATHVVAAREVAVAANGVLNLVVVVRRCTLLVIELLDPEVQYKRVLNG